MGDLVLSAVTFMSGVIEVATGTGIHGSNEHKIGRVGDALVSTRDGDGFVLKGLTEGFKDSALVLW